MRGLANIRVIDCSSWIAGPYSSKLFADAGADVIKIEDSDGDPMRHWSSTGAAVAGDSAFFQFINGGKRAVQAEPGSEALQQLIGDADLLIEDFATDSLALKALDIQALRKRHPHLVVLSISPYGRSGPYANRPATEFTIQAECGATFLRGLPELAPISAGGRTTDFMGGSYAAVAALAAVRGAQNSGRGEHIDFSLTEAMNIASTVFIDLMWSMLGRPELPPPFRSVESPSIEPSKDGWVGFNTNARQQFNDFLLLIERPDLIGDEELASAWTRQNRADEWNSIVRHWTMQHTTADIIEKAALFRIPVAPVNNGKSVLQHDQFVARKVYEANPGGGFLQPRPPYRINGERVRPAACAPAAGEHNGKIELRNKTLKVEDCADTETLPLTGIRILDATSWWAGPAATNILATLGAEVIHVESTRHLDGGRTTVADASADQWWERSHIYNAINTNKRSLTLDFKSPRGREILHSLIEASDVVVENFSPRVFEELGLDREGMAQVNPRAVFVRMPAFGLDGPWRDRVGFAQTMEQMSGLAWLTGHVDDQPRIQRGPCDPLAGMHAAFAILVGLAEAEHSGEGQFIEATMVEAALNAAAEQAIEYSAYGNLLQRQGNRSPYAAPQGLYPCAGEENWLALSIETDQQWQALLEVLGQPDWGTQPALSDRNGRIAAHDAIDAELEAWARLQELPDVVEVLTRAGIPAATVVDGRYSSKHPQFEARKFFEFIDHPVIGRHPIPGLPFRFSSRAGQPWLDRPAPTLGQHNEQILQELLGLNETELTDLSAQSIIGTQPFRS